MSRRLDEEPESKPEIAEGVKCVTNRNLTQAQPRFAESPSSAFLRLFSVYLILAF